jgi:hypothetical protein
MRDRGDWVYTVERLRLAASGLRVQAEQLRAASRRRRFLRDSPELSEAKLKERMAGEMEDAADRLERTFLTSA